MSGDQSPCWDLRPRHPRRTASQPGCSPDQTETSKQSNVQVGRVANGLVQTHLRPCWIRPSSTTVELGNALWVNVAPCECVSHVMPKSSALSVASVPDPRVSSVQVLSPQCSQRPSPQPSAKPVPKSSALNVACVQVLSSQRGQRLRSQRSQAPNHQSSQRPRSQSSQRPRSQSSRAFKTPQCSQLRSQEDPSQWRSPPEDPTVRRQDPSHRQADMETGQAGQ